jgi:hypothetical protein
METVGFEVPDTKGVGNIVNRELVETMIMAGQFLRLGLEDAEDLSGEVSEIGEELILETANGPISVAYGSIDSIEQAMPMRQCSLVES